MEQMVKIIFPSVLQRPQYTAPKKPTYGPKPKPQSYSPPKTQKPVYKPRPTRPAYKPQEPPKQVSSCDAIFKLIIKMFNI